MPRAYSPNKYAVIFDGDDTLWQTQVFYDEAKDRFFQLMQSQGFDADIARTLLRQVDTANVARLGFSKRRFPRSMQQVYKNLCLQNTQAVNPAIMRKVSRIGNSVFRLRPNLMPGVVQVLDQVRLHYRLLLYSGGDPHVQHKKISATGLAKYFSAVFVYENKSEIQLAEILRSQRLNIHRTWMIGNSLKSDINPALRLGLRCIWLRGGTWAYDNDNLLAGIVWQVDKLPEILTILSNTDGLL